MRSLWIIRALSPEVVYAKRFLVCQESSVGYCRCYFLYGQAVRDALHPN